MPYLGVSVIRPEFVCIPDANETVSTMTLEEIKRAAAELAPEDRHELAEYLISSAIEPESTALQGEILEAWLDEAERRVEALELGQVRGIPGDQAMREIFGSHK
jgi:hypothetical protein